MPILTSIPPGVLLAIGILAEVTATISLKLANGVERPAYLVPVGLGYLISFAMLSLVLKAWNVGFVYATWAGCGVAGVAAVGVMAFGEPFGSRELAGFCAIVIGVLLLSR